MTVFTWCLSSPSEPSKSVLEDPYIIWWKTSNTRFGNRAIFTFKSTKWIGVLSWLDKYNLFVQNRNPRNTHLRPRLSQRPRKRIEMWRWTLQGTPSERRALSRAPNGTLAMPLPVEGFFRERERRFCVFIYAGFETEGCNVSRSEARRLGISKPPTVNDVAVFGWLVLALAVSSFGQSCSPTVHFGPFPLLDKAQSFIGF